MADTAEKRGQNKDGSSVQGNMAQSVQHDRHIVDLCPNMARLERLLSVFSVWQTNADTKRIGIEFKSERRNC